ncbi:MAG: reverse transcriptase domain-containing protein [Serratia sp. (in: enterobacteria)]|uniref:reverse transcriptase domain-containing protein n=1 Tax=Serratia sp. (in: enterobacteria) TaxID=616 RepID=UPI003F2D283F
MASSRSHKITHIIHKYCVSIIALSQYIGVFPTHVGSTKGIPRASTLSPLLAAFHLTETDRYVEQQPHLRYAQFMDDFLIFARTRHHLRRAVKALNRFLTHYGFVKRHGAVNSHSNCFSSR